MIQEERNKIEVLTSGRYAKDPKNPFQLRELKAEKVQTI